jgi:hypothetical protein
MGQFGESNARELITRLIDSMGARDDRGIVPFVTDWPRIVGADLAAHSRVLDVRNGAAVVGLDHPAWLQMMHFKQERIIAAIQRSYPSLEVRYLHMTVVDSFGSGPSESPIVPSTEEREHAPREAIEPASHGSSVEKEDSVSGAGQDDPEFLQHLEGLREALKKKENDRGTP